MAAGCVSFAPEGLGLAFKIVAGGEESGQAARIVGQLGEERPIHLVSYPHTENGDPRGTPTNRPHQLGLLAGLCHPVGQNDYIQGPIGLAIALSGFQRRSKHGAPRSARWV